MKILLIPVLLFLAGCQTTIPGMMEFSKPLPVAIEKSFTDLHEPTEGPMVAAVYLFQDKSGQRKPSDKMAHISTAVTQGAEQYVIQSLREVGDGKWFKVVERVGLENLSRERQIIRQTRQSVADDTPLAPLMFAGIIVEGAIVGYDSNVRTGGSGIRYLGVGPSVQYKEDVITVTLRAVSVQTGEILTTTAVTKTVISASNNLGIFKFIEKGTHSLEIETGNSENEPINYAVRIAIEQAIIEMINEGADKNYWSYRKREDI